MEWYIQAAKLHAEQNQIIAEIRNNLDQENSYYWIRGFAGTGKTICLLHAMEQIANLHQEASICYITYTNALVQLVKTTPGFELMERITIQTVNSFLVAKKSYDYVFLDEVQDIEKGKLASIKRYAKRICLAGDMDQQIYTGCITSEEIEKTLQPLEAKRLNIIHRLRDSPCKFALAIFPDAQKNVASDIKIKKDREDTSIILARASREPAEIDWAFNEAMTRIRPWSPVAIILANHDEISKFANYISWSKNLDSPPKAPKRNNQHPDYTKFNNFFAKHNIPLRYLGGSIDCKESEKKALIYLMTIHSAKGLEFNHVFIPFMGQKDYLFSKKISDKDEKRLLFVALTRSRKALFISYTNELHSYFNNAVRLPVVNKIEIDHNNATDNEGDFF